MKRERKERMILWIKSGSGEGSLEQIILFDGLRTLKVSPQGQ